jgi:hypothetical protein
MDQIDRSMLYLEEYIPIIKDKISLR